MKTREVFSLNPILTVLTLILCFSCAGPGQFQKRESQPSEGIIVREAIRLASMPKGQPFLVNGRSYRYDCSGYVCAVWASAGIRTLESLPADASSANGVKLIHQKLLSAGKIYEDPALIRPGDLVFFDNTYDRNGNNVNDDLLIHIGVVTRSDPDGTVSFLNRTSKGIIEDRLNLRFPSDHLRDGAVVNTYLRKKLESDPPGTVYLCGQLVNGFGRH